MAEGEIRIADMTASSGLTNDDNFVVDKAGSNGTKKFSAADYIANKEELVNIRVAANGTTYPSAGDAVREQIEQVEKSVRYLSEYGELVVFPAFENGNIDDTTGDTKEAGLTTRIRTKDYISCDSVDNIAISDAKVFLNYIYYYNDQKQFIERVYMGSTVKNIAINKNYGYFKIKILDYTGASWSNTITPEIVVNNYTFYKVSKLMGEMPIVSNIQRGWTDLYFKEHDDSNFERVIIKIDKTAPLVFTGAATSNQYFYYLLFADTNGEYLADGKRTQTGNITDTVAAIDYPSAAVYAQITYAKGKAKDSKITNGNVLQIVTSEILPLLRNNTSAGVNSEIIIPNEITAVVGDTLQVYYDSIINSTDPVEVEILGTKGKAYPRYFEYTPTVDDIGESNLTINVKKLDSITNCIANTIATKTITLKTINKPASPSTEKHVLCVGDSTIVNGTFVKEVAKRICGSNYDNLSNIKFTGRLQKNVESGLNVGYEGFSGWNWNSYISGAVKAIRFYVSGVSSLNFEAIYEDSNGCKYNISEINVTEGSGNIRCLYIMGSATTTPPSSGTLTKISGSGDATITYTSIDVEEYSPFYVNNEVNFEPYIEEYCGGSVDYVVFCLGTNSIVNVNAEFSTIKSNILTQMNTLIGKLHEQFSNAKVLICTLQKGSMRGGFGANFGTAFNANSDFYNRKVYQLNKTYLEFAETNNTYVKVVNLSGEFDTLYNYPHIMKAVDTRDSDNTEMIDTNFGHPANNGYYQMADAIYRTIYNLLS